MTMSNSNTITLPREVVEQAINALFCTDSQEGSWAYVFELKAVDELRAAMEQADAIITTSVPTGWKLVPVKPSMTMTQTALNASRRWAECDAPLPRGRELWAADVCWVSMLDAAPQPPELEKPPSLFPLPADLYDSKDWRCGTYSERVEWLHTMYESAKEQIAALEQPQPNPDPYLWYDPENGDTWTQEAINDGCCPPDSLIALYTK